MNLNIGEVSKRTGLRAKTIRYYEDIGLVKPLRDTNDYRVFRETDLHKLIFLSRARALGSPLVIAATCWRSTRMKPAPVQR